MQIDIQAHLRNANYPLKERIGRVIWQLFSPWFRWSLKSHWAWRNHLLRLFGARIGKGVYIYPSARIFHPWLLSVGDDVLIGAAVEVYNLGQIRIGSHVLISQRAHLCAGTHSYREPNLPLVRSEIEIGDHVWIAAEAFIGPGIKLGPETVVGARAVVVKSFEGQGTLAGNPATHHRSRRHDDSPPTT